MGVSLAGVYFCSFLGLWRERDSRTFRGVEKYMSDVWDIVRFSVSHSFWNSRTFEFTYYGTNRREFER